MKDTRKKKDYIHETKKQDASKIEYSQSKEELLEIKNQDSKNTVKVFNRWKGP